MYGTDQWSVNEQLPKFIIVINNKYPKAGLPEASVSVQNERIKHDLKWPLTNDHAKA